MNRNIKLYHQISPDKNLETFAILKRFDPALYEPVHVGSYTIDTIAGKKKILGSKIKLKKLKNNQILELRKQSNE